MRTALLAVAAALVLALAGCGSDDGPTPAAGLAVAGHVHGIGVDPADGVVYLATHKGVYRLPAGGGAPERVGRLPADVMSLTVTGPHSFLASGHDPGSLGTNNLGLLASDDAGTTWKAVSLDGSADFHVLRAAGARVYGLDAITKRLLASDDGGRTWDGRDQPEGLLDVAVDPADPEHLVGVTYAQLVESTDGGRSWKPGAEAVGLLAWPPQGGLLLVSPIGVVSRSTDGGATWQEVGSVDGQPAAVTSPDGERLLVAVQDGRVHESSDGGRTWRELVGNG